MKKLIFAFVFCGFAALKSNAQQLHPFSLGLGAHFGKAFNDPFKSVLGGDVFLEKGVAKSLDVTLGTGFKHFFERDHLNGFPAYGSPFNVIPMRAGLRYYVYQGLFVGAEAGVGFGFEEWKTKFTWSAALGYTISHRLDVQLKYEDFGHGNLTRQLALGVAYKIKFAR